MFVIFRTINASVGDIVVMKGEQGESQHLMVVANDTSKHCIKQLLVALYT